MTDARLEVFGWFGAVASTHWLASQSAMGVLERGGNAFDAAVVAGFVMQVAQPHLNGPAGDVAILLRAAGGDAVHSICGQGPAPRGATVSGIRALGLDAVPGTGLLPAVVPGAFDAWMRLLSERGTLDVRDALAPAIEYAEKGVEVDQRLHETLKAAAPVFTRYWPTSAQQYLDRDGQPPARSARFRNAELAAVWRRMIKIAETTSADRVLAIEAARDAWSDGFVAAAIDTFCRDTRVMDVSGRIHGAFLTGADMAGWRAFDRPVISAEFAGHKVHKCGMWTQGPTLLQALNLLDAEGFADLDPAGAEQVHLLTEAMKLALADRDAHYGLSGPEAETRAEARLALLLSDDYSAARRRLLSDRASHEFRPGAVPGQTWRPDYAAAAARQREAGLLAAYGGGEPTVVYDPVPDAAPAHSRAYVERAVGDTSYLTVADAAGNVVSATPSGGWLQSSPVVTGLGFPLGTRAQMMWPDEAAPARLAPGGTPRSTLTPTLATDPDGGVLAVGTPGGDQQEQWQLSFLVRHLAQGLPMQTALDLPGHHTNHVVNSFYPRAATPGSLVVEERFAGDQIDDLRARGHGVTVVGPWAEGRVCAVRAAADGERRAAVTRRGGQALAVAR
ncbi:MAG: gamma-glutamyltransferase [Rhodobacteraceae bacterium]|nr:gamma-glutamyltransferase [Paracoccaceae bacterium]